LAAVACFLPGRAKDLSAPPRKKTLPDDDDDDDEVSKHVAV